MTDVKNFNSQSIGEEVANAISHCVGTLLAFAGASIIIVRAALYSGPAGITAASIYGGSLILLYLFSTLYHSLTNRKAKKVFQVFDHCSIFLLILGSYAPISLAMIGGAMGWVLFGINIFCTVLGVVFNAIDVARWHKISLVLYVLMGWSVIMIAPKVISSLTLGGLMLILGGGLCYTFGIWFYKNKTTKYMHFIWHLLVIAGSVLQYFFFLFYCYPAK